MSQEADNPERRFANVKREVDRVLALVEKAKHFLKVDADVSLFQARKAAEAICKQIYLSEGFDKKSKPPRKLMLGDFLTRFNQEANNGNRFMPEITLTHLSIIRDLGNLGTHDQGEESNLITTTTARQCFQSLSSVVDWYTEDYHAIPSKHSAASRRFLDRYDRWSND